MQCPGLELILGIADHGSPLTENQDAVTALAQIRPPVKAQAAALGMTLHPADKLTPSHTGRFGQICPNVNRRIRILASTDASLQSPAERHRAMTWAQRLQRVFKLDFESCEGQVRVIASLEDPLVIAKILSHLKRQQQPSVTTVPPLPARGPPRQGVLELS